MTFDWLRGRPESRGVTIAVWVNVVLLVFALAAMPFDHRLILGINPWIKPLKFDVSAIIFLETMAWMIARLNRARRTRVAIGWGIGLAMIVENTVISLQSLRGVPSHMNYTSLLNGALFGVMGLWILINTIFVAILFALYCTPKTGLAPGLVWGIRLGLFVLLVGSVEGVAMVMNNGHTVGAPDSGAGLPLLNWSLQHGDLRIPHFFALHALQALPFAGWLVARTNARAVIQVVTMVAIFAGYMAALWWLFAQAMAGRPPIS